MREHKNSVRKLKQRRDGVRDIAKVIPQVTAIVITELQVRDIAKVIP